MKKEDKNGLIFCSCFLLVFFIVTWWYYPYSPLGQSVVANEKYMAELRKSMEPGAKFTLFVGQGVRSFIYSGFKPGTIKPVFTIIGMESSREIYPDKDFFVNGIHYQIVNYNIEKVVLLVIP